MCGFSKEHLCVRVFRGGAYIREREVGVVGGRGVGAGKGSGALV